MVRGAHMQGPGHPHSFPARLPPQATAPGKGEPTAAENHLKSRLHLDSHSEQDGAECSAPPAPLLTVRLAGAGRGVSPESRSHQKRGGAFKIKMVGNHPSSLNTDLPCSSISG